MSEQRFYKLNSRFVDIEEPVIYDNFEQKALNIEQSVELLNKLYEENEQLRQIMNDIVCATDETYAKNASVFKVTVVLDFEKYMEIRRCIE